MRILQSPRSFFLFSLTVLAVKLWLVSAHHLMATVSPHDDLLFINQANSILSRQWLGEFNQMTLIKGQFYPLFIALSYWLNIPLLAAQQLLYGLASFLTIWAVFPLVRQKWPLYLLFLFLLLNPFSYNYPAIGRVFRLAIYGPLGLLTISCLIGLFVRTGQSLKDSAIWSVGAGLFLAAFWNTREESIWIAPAIVLLLAFAFYRLKRLPRSRAALLAGLYLLPLVMLWGANHTLEEINRSHYGIPATIELETPEFKAAYGGLLRINSDKWQQHFPVVRDARKKAYVVSPAFRELQTFLEGDLARPWKYYNDLPAAFFIWVFRDATAAAGYYQDAPSTLAFYQKIGDEIDQACAEGALDCSPRLTSLVPAWHREFNRMLLPTYFSILKRIISFSDATADIDGYLSMGPPEILKRFEIVTRERILPDQGINDRVKEPGYDSHLNKEKSRILTDIGTAYKLIIPALFLSALVIFLGISVRSIIRRELKLLTVASGAALSGILAIAFILTLVAITSYYQIGRAMHTAYPMVLLFIVMVVLDALSRIYPRETMAAEPSVTEW